MRNKIKSTKIKRLEREYFLSIKVVIVSQVERGTLTVDEAKKKYGIQDRSTILNWLVEFGRL